MKKGLILWVSLLAGGGDFVAGILLAFAPAQTLQLMHVPPARDLVWLQLVGVFVACVGALYLLGLPAWKSREAANRMKWIWQTTALFRIAAGTFFLIKVATGGLDSAWLSVTGTDYFWAFLQLVILWKGFPDHA